MIYVQLSQTDTTELSEPPLKGHCDFLWPPNDPPNTQKTLNPTHSKHSTNTIDHGDAAQQGLKDTDRCSQSMHARIFAIIEPLPLCIIQFRSAGAKFYLCLGRPRLAGPFRVPPFNWHVQELPERILCPRLMTLHQKSDQRPWRIYSRFVLCV